MFGKSATRNSVKPLARAEGLSVTTSGDETLVYDRERYVIHRLNTELATIWGLADGTHDMAMLADEAGVSSRGVEESLHTLTAMGLMQGDVLRISRFTRRHLFGSAAAAAAASTFIAPVAASGCNPNSDTYRPCFINGEAIGKQLCNHNPSTNTYEWGPCVKYI